MESPGMVNDVDEEEEDLIPDLEEEE
jgi:hypothetical protein